jgi:hypothetical protein
MDDKQTTVPLWRSLWLSAKLIGHRITRRWVGYLALVRNYPPESAQLVGRLSVRAKNGQCLAAAPALGAPLRRAVNRRTSHKMGVLNEAPSVRREPRSSRLSNRDIKIRNFGTQVLIARPEFVIVGRQRRGWLALCSEADHRRLALKPPFRIGRIRAVRQMAAKMLIESNRPIRGNWSPIVAPCPVGATSHRPPVS